MIWDEEMFYVLADDLANTANDLIKERGLVGELEYSEHSNRYSCTYFYENNTKIDLNFELDFSGEDYPFPLDIQLGFVSDMFAVAIGGHNKREEFSLNKSALQKLGLFYG